MARVRQRWLMFFVATARTPDSSDLVWCGLLVRGGLCLWVTWLVGLPIATVSAFLVWIVACVLVCTGVYRSPSRRALAGIAPVAIAGSILLWNVPRTRIQEAHQIFLGDGRALVVRQFLPDVVYEAMNAEFERKFPREHWCNEAQFGCWRSYGDVRTPWAFSADGFLQRDRKWSRVVSDVDYEGDGFRVAVLNSLGASREMPLNFYPWASDVRREQIPFWVQYEIPEDLLHGKLCHKGWVFWETAPGRFEELSDSVPRCRTIESDDVGKRIIGISGLKPEVLSIRIELPDTLKRWKWVRQTGSAVLLIAVLVSLIRIRISALVGLALTILTVIVVIGPKLWTDLDHVVRLPGGEDGLTYFGLGRGILIDLSYGDFADALMGGERIFYFVPGYRYFQALGGLLFGDTPLIVLAVQLASIYAIWKLSRAFWPVANASLVTLALYVACAKEQWRLAQLGYAEPLAYSLFVLAMALAVVQPKNDAAGVARGALCGALFALALFIRPNLAIAGVLVLAAVGARLLSHRNYRLTLALALGASLYLFVPLHNYFFGGTWVWFTSAAAIPENLVLPPEHWRIAIVLHGEYALSLVAQHIHEWLDTTAKQVLAYVFPVALAIAAWHRLLDWRGWILVLGIIGLHAPFIFYQATGRYAWLAWLMTLVAVLYFSSLLVARQATFEPTKSQ